MKTIETERLILRPYTIDDVEPHFRLGTDPEIIRYVGNVPFADMDEAQDQLERGPLRDYELYGYGRFACILKKTGELVGFSGLKFIAELEMTELGYRFWPELWGKGLATEAGAASVEFGRSLGLTHLIGLVDKDNKASARVLGKLGFAYEGKQDVSFWHGHEPVDRFGRAL